LSLGRQNDESLVVSPPLYETGLFGIADRQLQRRTSRLMSRPTLSARNHEYGLLELRR
jgi:hypothetical protein